MKYKIQALFMAFLIVFIPIYAAEAQAQFAEIPVLPGEACIDKVTAERENIEDMVDIIQPIEALAQILLFISTVINTIDKAIALIANVVGMFEGQCCRLGAVAGATTGTNPCQKMDSIYKKWRPIRDKFKTFNCFVNCGWCSGDSCGGFLTGNPINKIKTSSGQGIAGLGLSPYDNIYTAVACMCPIAIVKNLRKLVAIEHVNACCVEQACINGISTESCETQKAEAMCMFWQGSIVRSMVKMLMAPLNKFITKSLAKLIDGDKKMLNCILTAYELSQAPKLFDQLKSAFQELKKSFDTPECEDLGFQEIKPFLERDITTITQNIAPAGFLGFATLENKELSTSKKGQYTVKAYGDIKINTKRFYFQTEKGELLIKTQYDTNNDNFFDLEIDQTGAYEINIPIHEGMLAITGFAVTGSSAGPSSPGPSAQATQLASIITGKLTSLIMGEVDKQIQKMCKQTPDEGEEERVDEVIITQSS